MQDKKLLKWLELNPKIMSLSCRLDSAVIGFDRINKIICFKMSSLLRSDDGPWRPLPPEPKGSAVAPLAGGQR